VEKLIASGELDDAGVPNRPRTIRPAGPAPARTRHVVENEVLVATAVAGHDGHRGWIYYLAVRAGGRGRGHVAAMMRACEQWLHERAVPKLNVMVVMTPSPSAAPTRGWVTSLTT